MMEVTESLQPSPSRVTDLVSDSVRFSESVTSPSSLMLPPFFTLLKASAILPVSQPLAVSYLASASGAPDARAVTDMAASRIARISVNLKSVHRGFFILCTS